MVKIESIDSVLYLVLQIWKISQSVWFQLRGFLPPGGLDLESVSCYRSQKASISRGSLARCILKGVCGTDAPVHLVLLTPLWWPKN